MKIISEENLRYLSEQKFETEKSNKFTPKVLRDKMIEKFGSLDKENDKILVVESFEFCEDFKNLGFKNVSFMSDNLDKNKFVEGIYGFETFLLNLKETKNIKLNREIEMKFDKVIMNPPYGKLHLPILKKCVEEFVDIENGGEIVSLQPVNWLQLYNSPNKQKYATILNNKCNIDVIIKKGDYTTFDNCVINIDVGIYHFAKNIVDNVDIISNTIHGVDRRPFLKYIENNKETYKNIKVEIYDKTKTGVLIASITGGVGNFKFINYTNFIRTNYGLIVNGKVKNKNKYLEDCKLGANGKIDKWKIVTFHTEEEAQNFLDYCDLKAFRFFVGIVTSDVNIYYKNFLFANDYTEPWTDERFYEYFNISPEEQQIIDEALKEDK